MGEAPRGVGVPAILITDLAVAGGLWGDESFTCSRSRASWLRSMAAAISSCSSRSISSSGLLYRNGAGKGAAVPSAGTSSWVHFGGFGSTLGGFDCALGRSGEVSPLGPKKECIVDCVFAFFVGDCMKALRVVWPKPFHGTGSWRWAESDSFLRRGVVLWGEAGGLFGARGEYVGSLSSSSLERSIMVGGCGVETRSRLEAQLIELCFSKCRLSVNAHLGGVQPRHSAPEKRREGEGEGEGETVFYTTGVYMCNPYLSMTIIIHSVPGEARCTQRVYEPGTCTASSKIKAGELEVGVE